VTKIPRFTFEKFPQAKDVLTTQMKSVGEVMAIGRTFKESLQKAIRSLEVGSFGLEEKVSRSEGEGGLARIREAIRVPNAQRLWFLAEAFRWGLGIDEVHGLSDIDPWFLENILQIVDFERGYRESGGDGALLGQAKQMGFSDLRLGHLSGRTEEEIRKERKRLGIHASFRMVDTCGAEFEAHTPYLYSTYEGDDESRPSSRKKVIILGSGPNRIGQGIEFDYCCVHGAFALKEEGFEAIMVNCNPETVSTDYDTSDKLYFEPLTREDVLNIIDREKPDGVILQFGGQTPLKLAIPLEREGVRILGTSPDSIDLAEDRERFRDLIEKLGLKQPESGIARSEEEAVQVAERLGYPILVRPSYVLGGRAMEIIRDGSSLRRYVSRAMEASLDHPILLDCFLQDAVEIDIDAISDGETVVIGGMMEHVERAGIHSGDSACRLPPGRIVAELFEEIRRQVVDLAHGLKVVGLMNVQMALKDGDIYILEVNPRASRTVPFVSKAIGIPLAKLAAQVMVGRSLRELGFTKEVVPAHVAVKEVALPFNKFPGVDTLLGPEMKSTGEVMGIGQSFGVAFAKAQLAVGMRLPTEGTVFISVRNEDKTAVLPVARSLHESGLKLLATRGTEDWLRSHGVPAERIFKIHEGRPNIEDVIRASGVSLVINTPSGEDAVMDSYYIRRAALDCKVPYCTTVAGAEAAAEGIRLLRDERLEVRSLQEYHWGSGL
jgi:carbamoyl-phosphate synthase large subunit